MKIQHLTKFTTTLSQDIEYTSCAMYWAKWSVVLHIKFFFCTLRPNVFFDFPTNKNFQLFMGCFQFTILNVHMKIEMAKDVTMEENIFQCNPPYQIQLLWTKFWLGRKFTSRSFAIGQMEKQILHKTYLHALYSLLNC